MSSNLNGVSSAVLETEEIWKLYSRARTNWAIRAQEDRKFRLGDQWTNEDLEVLKARNQAPVVVNRIHPAVESAKAMLTANRPSFRVSPREDSDNQVAQAINGLLQYVWQTSDGDTIMRQVIDDYYVTGLGAAYVYVDTSKDMGKGEVCLIDIDPMTLYIDPAARSRFGDDAENIIISKLVTREQLKKRYPLLKARISNAQGTYQSDMPVTELQDTGIVFPEDSTVLDADLKDNFVREYIRFKKEYIEYYRVYDAVTGAEDLLNKDDYLEYTKKPAWIIGGQVYTSVAMAEQALQVAQQQAMVQAEQANQMAQQQAQQAANESGMEVPYEVTEPQLPEVRKITFADLINSGQIEVVKTLQPSIRQWVIVGQDIIYEGILEIEHYPVILFMNLFNRTPYPLSDVRMVKTLQEEINKTRSLIIAHATTSTTNKVVLQKGSVDIEDFEDRWASPTAAIEADLSDGGFQVVHPAPLPAELYQKETTAKSDIDHQMGLYEFMMGNSQNAPQTYKATISIDEFGQRRIKSKLMDVETGLKRMGEVMIPLMQKLYTVEKIVRVIQPNNSMSEYMINKRMYDDYGNVVDILNSISVGKYDVVVIAGSTLPTNRYAQLEFYMAAYEKGIIDRQEVLKKTEIFDQEGVMQRTDEIAKLQGMVQQMEEEIKRLRGDLQTRERETMHAKQETELTRFKSKLGEHENAINHSTQLFNERLNDELKNTKLKNRDTAKSAPKGKK